MATPETVHVLAVGGGWTAIGKAGEDDDGAVAQSI
jgi:hypothetical protein